MTVAPIFDIDQSTWPKYSDFTADERAKIFWSKVHWITYEFGRKIDDSTPDEDTPNANLRAKKGQQGRARAAEGINVKMRYVVDRDGVPVDGHRAAVIRSVARAFWNELSNKGLAPSKWKGGSSLQITEAYRLQMENLCEELRLCENGWKAEQIAIDNYSSWRVARMKGCIFNVILQPNAFKREYDEDKLLSFGTADGGHEEALDHAATVERDLPPLKKHKAGPDTPLLAKTLKGKEKQPPTEADEPSDSEELYAPQPTTTAATSGSDVRPRPLPRMIVSIFLFPWTVLTAGDMVYRLETQLRVLQKLLRHRKALRCPKVQMQDPQAPPPGPRPLTHPFQPRLSLQTNLRHPPQR